MVIIIIHISVVLFFQTIFFSPYACFTHVKFCVRLVIGGHFSRVVSLIDSPSSFFSSFFFFLSLLCITHTPITSLPSQLTNTLQVLVLVVVHLRLPLINSFSLRNESFEDGPCRCSNPIANMYATCDRNCVKRHQLPVNAQRPLGSLPRHQKSSEMISKLFSDLNTVNSAPRSLPPSITPTPTPTPSTAIFAANREVT